MGLSHLSVEELAAWVEASCAAQGLTVKVTDPALVRRVGALLGARVSGRARTHEVGAREPTPGGSVAPHDADPGRFEDLGSSRAGSDHDVVNQGRDDGVLSGEVQVRPGAA